MKEAILVLGGLSWLFAFVTLGVGIREMFRTRNVSYRYEIDMRRDRRELRRVTLQVFCLFGWIGTALIVVSSMV